jgi:hypothetical protein
MARLGKERAPNSHDFLKNEHAECLNSAFAVEP